MSAKERKDLIHTGKVPFTGNCSKNKGFAIARVSVLPSHFLCKRGNSLLNEWTIYIQIYIWTVCKLEFINPFCICFSLDSITSSYPCGDSTALTEGSDLCCLMPAWDLQ